MLQNKVAIVTGANSGIGRAVALELGKEGASVTIDYVELILSRQRNWNLRF